MPFRALRADVHQLLAELSAHGATDLTRFQGVVENGAFGLAFLVARHADDCAVLPGLRTCLRRALAEEEEEEAADVDFRCIGLVWDAATGRLLPPDGFAPAFRQCARAARFVLTLLTLFQAYAGGLGAVHANILLYDTERRVLERFDPLAYESPVFRTRELDAALQALFADLVGSRFAGLRRTWSPAAGLQQLQEAEGRAVVTDPVGFCQAWVMIYADVRLQFPHLSAEEIHRAVLSYAQKVGSLTELIRAYANAYADNLALFVQGLDADPDPVRRLFAALLRFLDQVRAANEDAPLIALSPVNT